MVGVVNFDTSSLNTEDETDQIHPKTPKPLKSNLGILFLV